MKHIEEVSIEALRMMSKKNADEIAKLLRSHTDKVTVDEVLGKALFKRIKSALSWLNAIDGVSAMHQRNGLVVKYIGDTMLEFFSSCDIDIDGDIDIDSLHLFDKHCEQANAELREIGLEIDAMATEEQPEEFYDGWRYEFYALKTAISLELADKQKFLDAIPSELLASNAQTLDESMDANEKEEFKKKLRSGKVEFKYKKKDGTVHKVVGTMDPSLMDLPQKKTQSAVDNAEKKNASRLPEDSVFYYDIGSKRFRSFKMENFIAYGK